MLHGVNYFVMQQIKNNMLGRALILIFTLFAGFQVNASMLEDGKGFFPVIVQVIDADTGTPIKGAIIRLEGAGDYRETEIDPKRQIKVLPESLGKPVTTDTQGVGVVFFFGGFSSTTIDGKTTYSRPLVGTVVVEHEGKEIYRSTLKAWAEKNQFKPDISSVPLVVVSK